MPVALTVVLDAALFLIAPLARVQLPVLPVTHLVPPPGEKLPLTVAFGTAAPVETSRTVTRAEAFQLPPLLLALPLIDLTATVDAAGSAAGALPPSEYSNRFGEPVPSEAETRRFAVAPDTRSDAIAPGDAPGFAASASAAAPATCGDAMEVPLSVLLAVALVFQAEVMPAPGANRSTHVPQLENEAR